MRVAVAEKERGAAGVRLARWVLPASLAGAAFLSCLAVAAASLRHTSSLAFPIDDGYIYSNYVLSAAHGHFFTYNAGETSGGITSAGWYLLSTIFYWLLLPFHSLLGGLAPPSVTGAPALANEAGHLYLSAYIPGAICLCLAAIGTHRLARLVLPELQGEPAREALCWLAGAAVALDAALVWGAMSGLEVSLSCALAVWAVLLLIEEAEKGALRWSLLLGALLPFARPDLIVVGLAGVLWLLLRALLEHRGASDFRRAGVYALSLVGGFSALALFYAAGWGRPLPSSFYAKVGGLRFGGRFFSAVQELWLAAQWPIFLAGGLALLAAILLLWRSGSRMRSDRPAAKHFRAALIVLLATALYTAAIMFTLPWFGQENRYLLPIHPFGIVLLSGLAWLTVGWLLARLPGSVSWAGAVALAVGLLLFTYLWATQNYVVEVRNIDDAHVKPARWFALNTPRDATIASEPIGAVKLFSERRTVDLVGLTTPSTLGTYRVWSLAWPALHSEGASYLLYYPHWFDSSKPPAWAVQAQRYDIPDNRIAGDNLIAIYRLDWSRFGGASGQASALP